MTDASSKNPLIGKLVPTAILNDIEIDGHSIPSYIAVEGPMGIGKNTLATLL